MAIRSTAEAHDRVLQWREAISADSEMYSRLALSVAASDDILELIRTAPPGQLEMNLLFAAVQSLLLADPDHELAQWYPSLGGARTGSGLEETFAEFVAANSTVIQNAVMTKKVQTNEVARCCFLLPAYNLVQSMAGEPVALIEVGTSAGLNQNVDRYGYTFRSAAGTTRLGASSRLQLECATGERLPATTSTLPDIVWRTGLDVDPIDVTDPEQARWLRSLVWPDRLDRHARLAAAIEIARQHPPTVVAGDAFDALPGLVEAAPTGAAIVIQHSFVLNQFSGADRIRLFDLLDSLAAGRAIYRVGAEWAREFQATLLEVTVHGPKKRTIDLGEVHHHGSWIRLYEPGTVAR